MDVNNFAEAFRLAAGDSIEAILLEIKEDTMDGEDFKAIELACLVSLQDEITKQVASKRTEFLNQLGE
jgi:hypothetical protein